MTASVRIVVDERKDAIRVPNQALRYRPSDVPAPANPVAATGGPAAGAGPQAPVQLHQPGAGGSQSQAVAGAAGAAPADRLARSHAGGAGRIWLLRNGRPEPIEVVTGLDDGNFTEIMSGNVQPGDQVVTGEETAAQSAARPVQPRLRL